MHKIKGVFCLNSKCKHYFEDSCMLIQETGTVNISKTGKCEEFVAGEYIGYADRSDLTSVAIDPETLEVVFID